MRVSCMFSGFALALTLTGCGKPVVLRIKNLDASPMEFESKSLRVEKVLSGNGEAVINLRPQKPGRYEFFDDFHAATTKGVVVVK